MAVRLTTPLGDVATLVVLGPGDVMGELALVGGAAGDGRPRPWSWRGRRRWLHRDEFEELRRTHPSVQALLVSALAAQVDRVSGLLVERCTCPPTSG